MVEETAADRQAAQQAREQEKRHQDEADDSATAVSPDTQRADPGDALEDAPDEGEAARGQSAVFDDPAPPRPAGHADDDRL